MNHKTGCTLSWLTLNYSVLAYLRLSSTPSFGHLGHFKESDMNWNTEQIWFSNYYFVKCMAIVYVIYYLTNRQWFSRCSVYHGGLSDRRNSDVLSWLSIMSFSFADVLGEWASRHVSPMLLQGLWLGNMYLRMYLCPLVSQEADRHHVQQWLSLWTLWSFDMLALCRF